MPMSASLTRFEILDCALATEDLQVLRVRKHCSSSSDRNSALVVHVWSAWRVRGVSGVGVCVECVVCVECATRAWSLWCVCVECAARAWSVWCVCGVHGACVE
uniref:Uncharacterized protein n=1 Tax=Chlamydomonas euryale TaxID=1486919 RepID=A0A7R9VKN0_9CHLO|mmetsp:Transcript_3822/g.10913  ORF Transcript_3822/g.10913 Transcript_3822/m.10913 type:complete len:103 (+) Transcript_3822:373-681(+)